MTLRDYICMYFILHSHLFFAALKQHVHQKLARTCMTAGMYHTCALSLSTHTCTPVYVLYSRKRKEKTTQAVKTTPHIK